MPHWHNQPWQRNLSKSASGKTGAVQYDVNTEIICAISTAFLSTLNSSNVVNTEVENHGRFMFDHIEGPRHCSSGKLPTVKSPSLPNLWKQRSIMPPNKRNELIS
jgi:hypothetical protein